MKPFKPITGFLSLVVFFLALNLISEGQVIVNNKNLNDDKDLEYIQLMYYVEKSTLKPVFYVDYGFIEPEYTDIIDPERDFKQKITINGEEVTEHVTVVWLLNQMNKAGWEYMGDVVYLPMRMMDKWHVFTLRRGQSLADRFETTGK